MSKVFDIYEVLERYNYKFPIHEMNLRWDIFAAPRDIKGLVDERSGKLQKT